MEFIRPTLNFDFIGKRKLVVALSALALMLIGVLILVVKGGPRYGIDFTGGTSSQLKFETVRRATSAISARPVESAVSGQAVVQAVVGKSNEYIIQVEQMTTERAPPSSSSKPPSARPSAAENVEMSAAQMVGPKAGKELRKNGLYAILAPSA